MIYQAILIGDESHHICRRVKSRVLDPFLSYMFPPVQNIIITTKIPRLYYQKIISSNGCPHAFFFSIHYDFLPPQFVNIDLFYSFPLLFSKSSLVFIAHFFHSHLILWVTSWMPPQLQSMELRYLNHPLKMIFLF